MRSTELDLPEKSMNVPSMSTKSVNPNELLGECLFGKVRRQILSTLMLHHDRSFYVLELIRLLQCGRGAVQRELSRLSRAGIVIRLRRGNQVHFRVNQDCLIYRELRSIFSKTTGLVEALESILEPVSSELGIVFIHGEYAAGTAGDETPIRLAVIGDSRPGRLPDCARSFQTQTGRKLVVSAWSTRDFRRGFTTGDQKVREVLGDEKIFLQGTRSDLDVVTTRQEDLFSSLLKEPS